METKLEWIAEVAKTRPKEKFTSLAHLINVDSLKECHRRMAEKRAAGNDGVAKAEYEANLEENLKELIAKMKRQAYKPQPVKRVYIPKPGTEKKRPLGLPAYEDKLVQARIAEILNAIYEQEFLDCSFGFREKRGCHDALKVLGNIVNKPEINYVVDVDIKEFFDRVDHGWMKKFIENRIADFNLQRIIYRFMKAGIIEAGISYETPEGVPQGGVVSPILANIYLHYVIDLWFEKVVRRQCQGAAYMVRYADDNVFCFQNREEARKFYQDLEERLRKFGLEIAAEKSKIVSLGKERETGIDKDDEMTGTGLGSFDFLGFTHYAAMKSGRVVVKRKTSKKKFKASLQRVKEWLKANMHTDIKDLMKKLGIKLTGHIRYYGVTCNSGGISRFIWQVRWLLYRALNRRSQRKGLNWSKFKLFLQKYPLPKPIIYVNIFQIGVGRSYLL